MALARMEDDQKFRHADAERPPEMFFKKI